MDFTGKQAVITGGANGIGRCIAEYFLKANAYVTIIDTDYEAGMDLVRKQPKDSVLAFIEGDITDSDIIDTYVSTRVYEPTHFVINNACISRKGLLSNCTREDFDYVQRVGVTAPYYLVSSLVKANALAEGASIVNIVSTRANQSQADTESYSAAKGGILALTHAMSISLAGKARVNAISPGWIDVADYHHSNRTPANHSKQDKTQHPVGRVGKPEDIAEIVMFLCDNSRAGFITGENIVIDGGMSKLMVYHGDRGWNYRNST
ncbi:MAG: SDR family oxidoreductase [Defluviitaleaceae bacterium]|nr:SDR family oxidoreductase [Defluviitaleaceae bacterium]